LGKVFVYIIDYPIPVHGQKRNSNPGRQPTQAVRLDIQQIRRRLPRRRRRAMDVELRHQDK
jgi:hypothetical protein